MLFVYNINNMDTYRILRQLAKSVEMQNLFIAAKDLSQISLFKNREELSKIQSIFLNYLYFYDNLNKDIIMYNLSEKILLNEIYEDAYTIYKRKNPNLIWKSVV